MTLPDAAMFLKFRTPPGARRRIRRSLRKPLDTPDERVADEYRSAQIGEQSQAQYEAGSRPEEGIFIVNPTNEWGLSFNSSFAFRQPAVSAARFCFPALRAIENWTLFPLYIYNSFPL